MSKAIVEIDFFGMEKQSESLQPCRSEQRSSIRGWQKAIAKISPQLFNKVLAASEAQKVSSYGSSPDIRVVSLTSRSASDIPAPLTIFYKGKVNVFDVPPVKAETIIKLAKTGIAGVPPFDPVLGKTHNQELLLLEKLRGDLPIARKKSLHTFFTKRKERLKSVGPYPTTSTTSSCYSSHEQGDHGEKDHKNKKKKMTTTPNSHVGL